MVDPDGHLPKTPCTSNTTANCVISQIRDIQVGGSDGYGGVSATQKTVWIDQDGKKHITTTETNIKIAGEGAASDPPGIVMAITGSTTTDAEGHFESHSGVWNPFLAGTTMNHRYAPSNAEINEAIQTIGGVGPLAQAYEMAGPSLLSRFGDKLWENKWQVGGHLSAAIGFSACLVAEPCGGMVAGAAIAEGLFATGEAVHDYNENK
jgi:hypothetical protein